jgi:PRC-barrel domain
VVRAGLGNYLLYPLLVIWQIAGQSRQTPEAVSSTRVPLDLSFMEAKMKRLGSAAALALLLILPFGAVPASAANPPEQTITSLPSGALPISDYYNQSVYDPQDNKIGDVKDLLVSKNGNIDAAIIGVGGFLGVGEKNVAVPFNALKLTDKNGKRYLVLNTTKEALKSAAGYTFDRSAYQWVPAKQG